LREIAEAPPGCKKLCRRRKRKPRADAPVQALYCVKLLHDVDNDRAIMLSGIFPTGYFRGGPGGDQGRRHGGGPAIEVLEPAAEQRKVA
jgi:hypothetical protein